MDKKKEKTEISDSRKLMYYGGLVLIVFGFLIFISNMFSSANSDMMSYEYDGGNMVGTALFAMGLIVVGSIVRSIGARGVAGSGIVLDPEKAREDLKPYSQAAGGMVKDALESADIITGKETVIKVRCLHCDALNDENSKYCGQCGDPIGKQDV